VIVNFILFFALLRGVSTQIGIAFPRFEKMRELLNFGLPTVPNRISGWAMQSSDRYLIAFFIGIVAVGIYSPAYVLGFMGAYLIAPLVFVLPPTLSEMYDKNKKHEVKSFLSFSIQYLFFFTIPILFGLLIFSKEILLLLSTEKIANEGYQLVPIIAASTLFWGLSSIYFQIFLLVKRTKIISAITVAGALINILLNILLIPYFGIIGAAFTTLIAYIVSSAGMIYFSRSHMRFSIDYIFISKTFICAMLMGVLLHLLKTAISMNRMILLALIGLGVIIYFGLMLSTKGLKIEMIKKIISIMKSS
jgi:O-antigen/teichoic acid export membrane protein